MKIREYDYLSILKDSLDDAIRNLINDEPNLQKGTYYLGCVIENLSCRIDELELESDADDDEDE
jgi:hypothetical protein